MSPVTSISRFFFLSVLLFTLSKPASDLQLLADELTFGYEVEKVHHDEVELVKYLRKLGISYNLNNMSSSPDGTGIVNTDNGRVINIFMTIDKRLTEQELQPLLAARELVSIDCPAWAEDEYLDFFTQPGRFPRIHLIGINNAKITDKGMAGLKNLPRLRAMNIKSRVITDEGIQNLSQVSTLRLLRLYASRITDHGLFYLPQLADLYHLELNGTQVTDEGLKYLAQIRKLKLLYLDNTKVNGSGLDALASLQELTQLSLKDTPFDDRGMTHLAEDTNFRRLQCLYLSNTKITDKGCVAFDGLNELKVLSFDGTAITDQGIRHLNYMPRLYNLSLSSHVTQAGTEWLGANARFDPRLQQSFAKKADKPKKRSNQPN
jgi:hypothetical protein